MEQLLEGLSRKFPQNETIEYLLRHQVKLNFVLMGYIADAFEKLGEEKFFPHLMSLLNSLVFFHKKYSQISGASERVTLFHRDVDEIIARDLFGKADFAQSVKCTKGCSGCCSQYVSATVSEVELLMKHGPPPELGRLEKQSRCNEDNWTDLLREDEARCTYLDTDGSCLVWAHRPANCRNYFVTGSNLHCSIFNRDSDISRSHKSILADVCISAFYSLEGGAHSLAATVYERCI